MDTKQIVEKWPGLWQCPRLFAAIREQSSHKSASDLARCLVRDLAHPGTPVEVFERLIFSGEFHEAELLLDESGFAGAVGENNIELFGEMLDSNRRAARDAVQQHVANLNVRAACVGRQQEEPESLMDLAVSRRTDADMFLDDWESEISKLELNKAAQVREQLQDRTRTGDPETPATRVWIEAVLDCVNASEFEAGEFLLDSGPGAESPDTPRAVPRMMEWPFHDPLQDVLEWFNGKNSPTGFLQRWAPGKDDTAGHDMLLVLQKLGVAGSPTAELTREFAMVLERFTGTENPVSLEAIPCPGGFETRIFGICDIRLPCLAALSGDGVRLRLLSCDHKLAREPQATWRAELLLPDRRLTVLMSFVLEAIHAPKDRRVHFLRDLGRQMPLSGVVGLNALALNLPDTIAERRHWLKWMLNLAAAEAASEVVVEMILFYSGCHHCLVLHFLNYLFGSLHDRTDIQRQDVRDAWDHKVFRSRAMNLLLVPLDSDEFLREVLVAVINVVLRPGDWFTTEEVELMIPKNRVVPGKGQTSEKLNELHKLDLLDQSDDKQRYRVPISGVGNLILDVFPNEIMKKAIILGKYLRSGTQAFSKPNGEMAEDD